MRSRRFFLVSLLATLFVSCQKNRNSLSKLTIGIINFDAQESSLDNYMEFKEYLSQQLLSVIELEPTYNEINALNQIQRKRWDLIFAPSGLAAVAVKNFLYEPIFALEGALKNRSIIVVLNDSPYLQLSDLSNQIVALGQLGSTTGYYLPLYNLYGLTLAEVRFAPSSEKALDWLQDKKVAAIAMSLAKFNRYIIEFPRHPFRILYTDNHDIPNGSVLISSGIESYQQNKIRQALMTASPLIISSVGYVTNIPVPNYQGLIKIIDKVTPLEDQLQNKPVKIQPT